MWWIWCRCLIDHLGNKNSMMAFGLSCLFSHFSLVSGAISILLGVFTYRWCLISRKLHMSPELGRLKIRVKYIHGGVFVDFKLDIWCLYLLDHSRVCLDWGVYYYIFFPFWGNFLIFSLHTQLIALAKRALLLFLLSCTFCHGVRFEPWTFPTQDQN